MNLLTIIVNGFVDRLINRGSTSRATSLSRRYVRLRPNDDEAWVMWARASLGHAGVQEMIRVLREGYARLPDSLSLVIDLVGALNAVGEFTESKQILEDVESRFPRAAEPQLGRASLAVHKREWAEAKKHAANAEAIIVEAQDGELLVDLATVIVAIPGERDWATRLLELATSWHPGHAYGQLLLSVLYREHRPDEADERFRAAAASWRGSISSIREREREIAGMLS